MNWYRTVRTSLSVFLALTLAASHLSLTVAHAQSAPDSEPPVIDIDPLNRSSADAKQVFTARVSDNQSLEAVTLHHRRSGEQSYLTDAMRALGTSNFYTVTIETDPRDLRPIEYYVQARDAAGNRTVNRFAFDPYSRELIARAYASTPSAPASAPPPAPADAPDSSSRKWWVAALGLLVVGAVAAAASSSDSGGGSDNDDGVPLTLNIQEP